MEFDLDSLLSSESYTYQYFLQGDVCRLCWQRNPLASSTMNLNSIKIDVADVVSECLDVDLCEVNYPNSICEKCLGIVIKFYSFKIYCKKADRKLREIIETGCQTNPIEIEVKLELKNECRTDNVTSTTEDELNKEEVTTNSKTICKSKITKPKRKQRKTENYCCICFREFQDSKKLDEHNFKCHGIQNGMYKCFGCNKMFKTPKTRNSHETNFCRALKEGYKCHICNRYLPLRKLYEAHMRYHAGKDNDVVLELTDTENIFNCRKCNEAFKTKDYLKDHIMEKHKSIDNHYVCETCGTVFARLDYLQKHRLIHSGTKRHVCSHCGLRFVQKSTLNVHLRKHTGERPYECDVCPQRCVSSSNLRAHRRRHLGIKQFECAACGKKFGYKPSLAEHVSAAHAHVRRAGRSTRAAPRPRHDVNKPHGK